MLEIITKSEFVATRQAVILVGGRGTRLGALARNTPKPLMQIDEVSVFLDHLLFNVARQGFNDIILLAGHLSYQVSERYHEREVVGARIRVAVEPEAAGTAGALVFARDLLQATFLLANGDTLFDINFRPLDVSLASDFRALAVLAMRHVDDAGRYGRIDMDGGYVRGFHEKENGAAQKSGLINAGVGIFRRDILNWINKSPCSMETDVYPHLAANGVLLGQEFGGYFIDIGLPNTLEQARIELPIRRRRPALFLDRDGVLNEDKGYTHRPEDLKWISGAREAIRKANDLGILTIVVSNQAGIAHGYYEEEAVSLFHSRMQQELGEIGAHIDAFYICPFHAESAIAEWRHPNHPDRKPNPGMIFKAMSEWPINAAASAMIGDRDSDVEAARRAGLTGFLFTGGSLADFIEPVLRLMQSNE